MIIQNKIITIYWKPWSWKTLLSLFFASFYCRKGSKIYSNVDYFFNKKKINETIKDIKDIKKIPPQSQKWLVVVDEWWVNINSRRSMSDDNIELWQLWMLSRKKNIDIIVIAQLDYTIDKYYRDLSRSSFYMRSFFIKKDYLIFEADIFKNDNFFWKLELDLLFFIKNSLYSYDTAEESIFKKTKKIEKPKIEDILEKNLF